MFLSSNEYLNIAKKALIKWGAGQYQNDDEALGFVAEMMMWADHNFNGKGSRYGYRGSYAKFGVLKWKAQKRREGKKRMLSLDLNLRDSDNSNLVSLISTKSLDISTILEYNEVIEVAEKILNANEFFCLISRYCHGMTLQKIADELKISRERVRQIICIAIDKMKEKMDVS